MGSIDYKVEELRGIFAIGGIAIIAAFKTEIQNLPYFGPILEVLAACWAAYVLIMAVGVSGDVLWPWFARQCAELAHACFSVGVLISIVLLAIAGISWYGSATANSRSLLYVIVGSIAFIYAVDQIRKRKSRRRIKQILRGIWKDP